MIVLGSLVLGIDPGSAQIPDTFTNLKVLPKDTPKNKLVANMRGFASALGVRCNHCHVGEDPNTLQNYDFASDEKETKRVARAMLQMVNEINTRLLPATGREHLEEVGCVTCHHGVQEPETLEHILLEEAEKGGAPAAAARYRELRGKYYGTGAYDFSFRSLGSVAETMAQAQQNVDGGIEMMKLAVEFEPNTAMAHLQLGRLYMAKGDKPAAIASIEQAVKLEPDNQFAKQLLERAKAAP
jgi:tetratricopeptide (TPR) repeat protein